MTRRAASIERRQAASQGKTVAEMRRDAVVYFTAFEGHCRFCDGSGEGRNEHVRCTACRPRRRLFHSDF